MSSKKIISTILRFTTFVLAVCGVIAASQGTFMGQKTFLYFTTQSNIAIGLTCLVFGIFDVLIYCKKMQNVPRWLNVVKYVFTVAITLTLIVFWTMLAPVEFADYPEYLATAENILCHTLVPMLAIADFLLDTNNFQTSKTTVWYSISFPLVYFVFVVIVSLFNVDFGYGARVPYFFLDFYQYGWFSLASFPFGVFYWILIVVGIVLGIGALLILFKNFCNKKTPTNG